MDTRQSKDNVQNDESQDRDPNAKYPILGPYGPSIFRYKLSDPEILFETKCLPETCIDQAVPQSLATVLDEAFQDLIIDETVEGLRGAADAFEPSGTAVSPELRRQEFVSYLRQTGFIADLAKLFVTLHEVVLPEDKDAPELICQILGYGLTAKMDVDRLNSYKESLEKELKKYQKERSVLRRVLDHFESSGAEKDWINPTTLPPLDLLEDEGEVNPFIVEERVKLVDLTEPLVPQSPTDFFDEPHSDDIVDLGGEPSLPNSSYQ